MSDKKIGIKEDGTPYRILIVDDSPMIHKMIQKTVEPMGFTIVGNAKNGKEGVELYDKLKPDLVTMDITMPIMDGVDASENIIKNDPMAVILMLSAMGDDDIKEQAKSKGIRHFITKPFQPAEFIKSIVYTLKIKI
ncbi:MAG: response regulator [Fusobacteria bacterium]|nr:response regulator [Fusobacteriota bacterium]